jgi:methylmalonyl-CoA/ethylmalonyl-CoA epimerase
MIGNLNHIAIAVPDLDAAIRQYKSTFGAFVTSPQDLPDHGVRVAMVNLPNTKIELITPLGENSPIQNFLEKHPLGGIHHLCYEVEDIQKARDQLTAAGLEVAGDSEPKPGFHGHPVLFFHPKSCFGVLIELEEVPAVDLKGRVEVQRIGPVHTFPQSSIPDLEGIEGIGIGIEVDFKRKTPPDNKEEED